MFTREAALYYLKLGRKSDTLLDIARKDYLAVTDSTSILRLVTGIFYREISFVLVLSDGTSPRIDNVRGLITKERLADFISEAVEQFPP